MNKRLSLSLGTTRLFVDGEPSCFTGAVRTNRWFTLGETHYVDVPRSVYLLEVVVMRKYDSGGVA